MLGGLPHEQAGNGSLKSESSTIDRFGERTVIDQRYISEIGSPACGPTSCAMILNDNGKVVNISEIAKDAGFIPNIGTDVVGLTKVLQENGISSANWRTNVTIDQLSSATSNRRAAIARVVVSGNEGHFVVVDGVTKRQGVEVVAIRDPGLGMQYFVPVKDFMTKFSGQVVFTN